MQEVAHGREKAWTGHQRAPSFFPDLDRLESLPFSALLQEKGSISIEVNRRIVRKIEGGGLAALAPAERAVYFVQLLLGEVRNGGFRQYFDNASGDTAADALDSLRLLEAPKETVTIIADALSVFPSGPSRDASKRDAQIEALDRAALARWDTLSERLVATSDAFVEHFVRHHADAFDLGAR